MTRFQLIRFPVSQPVRFLVTALACAGIAGKVAAQGSESADGHDDIAELIREISPIFRHRRLNRATPFSSVFCLGALVSGQLLYFFHKLTR